MQLVTVKVEKPDDTNFILGQTHFIKSEEDIHEALVAGGRCACITGAGRATGAVRPVPPA